MLCCPETTFLSKTFIPSALRKVLGWWILVLNLCGHCLHWKWPSHSKTNSIPCGVKTGLLVLTWEISEGSSQLQCVPGDQLKSLLWLHPRPNYLRDVRYWTWDYTLTKLQHKNLQFWFGIPGNLMYDNGLLLPHFVMWYSLEYLWTNSLAIRPNYVDYILSPCTEPHIYLQKEQVHYIRRVK